MPVATEWFTGNTSRAIRYRPPRRAEIADSLNGCRMSRQMSSRVKEDRYKQSIGRRHRLSRRRRGNLLRDVRCLASRGPTSSTVRGFTQRKHRPAVRSSDAPVDGNENENQRSRKSKFSYS